VTQTTVNGRSILFFSRFAFYTNPARELLIGGGLRLFKEKTGSPGNSPASFRYPVESPLPSIVLRTFPKAFPREDYENLHKVFGYRISHCDLARRGAAC
jgi:hypothetical protein